MKSWLTTTDHKRIGLLYFFAAFAFFLIGGVRTLVARRGVQLHRHHPEPAGARHENDARARLHVDDAGDAVPRHHRVPGDHRGARVPDVRPLLRHALLREPGGRDPDPVAASVLAVRPPRGEIGRAHV